MKGFTLIYNGDLVRIEVDGELYSPACWDIVSQKVTNTVDQTGYGVLSFYDVSEENPFYFVNQDGVRVEVEFTKDLTYHISMIEFYDIVKERIEQVEKAFKEATPVKETKTLTLEYIPGEIYPLVPYIDGEMVKVYSQASNILTGAKCTGWGVFDSDATDHIFSKDGQMVSVCFSSMPHDLPLEEIGNIIKKRVKQVKKAFETLEKGSEPTKPDTYTIEI